jgi:hypothetical protein
MGLLVEDTRFWADVLNDLVIRQPPLGQPLSKIDAQGIQRVACTALTALVNDPDFPKDVVRAVELMNDTPTLHPNEPSFPAFYRTFIILEDKILEEAGVNSVAAHDIRREIYESVRGAYVCDTDRLEDKIRYLQKLACDPETVDPKKGLLASIVRGLKGVAVLAIDIGSGAVATGMLGVPAPVGVFVFGSVMSLSSSRGVTLIGQALSGHW